jgi:hypothetical protein
MLGPNEQIIPFPKGGIPAKGSPWAFPKEAIEKTLNFYGARLQARDLSLAAAGLPLSPKLLGLRHPMS